MDKEKWIQDILSSTKEKIEVQPGADFTLNLFTKLNNLNSIKTTVVPIKWVTMAACAACLLVVVNISTLHKWSESKQTIIQQTEAASTSSYLGEELSPGYGFN